jgi:ABC-type multidrug transport system fused ATPase/permease subunit
MSTDSPKRKITLSGLKKLFELYSFMRPYRVQYMVGMVFLLFSSGASLVFPKLLGDLVNVGSSGLMAEEINRVILIILAVLAVQAITSYFRIVTFVNVTEKNTGRFTQVRIQSLGKAAHEILSVTQGGRA